MFCNADLICSMFIDQDKFDYGGGGMEGKRKKNLASGWGLSRMMVWRGFAVTLGWNTFFLILATVILKLRT
ncbi:ABC transporter G family member 23-like protein [Lates japonicus]|uniref:ABC transporter G family member 23-like protein n=1 Tax=Lates japonicus TaxID=270547 RepID=A0AAD3NE91_LATJO|nr:ABC transporter G family member 23-like protein [Lates japonicus]